MRCGTASPRAIGRPAHRLLAEHDDLDVVATTDRGDEPRHRLRVHQRTKSFASTRSSAHPRTPAVITSRAERTVALRSDIAKTLPIGRDD